MRASEKTRRLITRWWSAAVLAVGMMSLSGAAHADDPIKRLLDLQLKKGIITQEEYDEFMSATRAESTVPAETEKKAEPGAVPPDGGTGGTATGVVAVPAEAEKKA